MLPTPRAVRRPIRFALPKFGCPGSIVRRVPLELLLASEKRALTKVRQQLCWIGCLLLCLLLFGICLTDRSHHFPCGLDALPKRTDISVVRPVTIGRQAF